MLVDVCLTGKWGRGGTEHSKAVEAVELGFEARCLNAADNILEKI